MTHPVKIRKQPSETSPGKEEIHHGHHRETHGELAVPTQKPFQELQRTLRVLFEKAEGRSAGIADGPTADFRHERCSARQGFLILHLRVPDDEALHHDFLHRTLPGCGEETAPIPFCHLPGKRAQARNTHAKDFFPGHQPALKRGVSRFRHYIQPVQKLPIFVLRSDSVHLFLP